MLRPPVIGGVALFAEENAVYAIRVSDGKQLWRRAFSSSIAAEAGAVYCLWQSGGRVVVLTGQVSDSARLTADLASGPVLWSRQAGQSLGPAAVGPVIAAGAGGRVAGYDSRTGRVTPRPVARATSRSAARPAHYSTAIATSMSVDHHLT